jgi:NADPH:quinone reductase-like Zn-dependent oxidoreductase
MAGSRRVSERSSTQRPVEWAGLPVQLARSAGAEVVGTASAANADYVRGLGAAAVIDYRSPDVDLASQGRFDVVLDLVGGDVSLQSLRAMRPGGVMVGGVPPSEELQQQAAAAQVRVLGIQVHPDGRQLREIAALIDAGKVGTTVAACLRHEPDRSCARAEQVRTYARQDRRAMPVVKERS